MRTAHLLPCLLLACADPDPGVDSAVPEPVPPTDSGTAVGPEPKQAAWVDVTVQFGWDAASGTAVPVGDTPPTLFVVFATAAWDPSAPDPEETCTVAVELTGLEDGGWAAAEGWWLGLETSGGPATHDCQDFDLGWLAEGDDLGAAVAGLGWSWALGGPLQPPWDETFADIHPSMADTVFGAEVVTALSDEPLSSYAVAYALDESGELLRTESGGLVLLHEPEVVTGDGVASALYAVHAPMIAL